MATLVSTQGQLAVEIAGIALGATRDTETAPKSKAPTPAHLNKPMELCLSSTESTLLRQLITYPEKAIYAPSGKASTYEDPYVKLYQKLINASGLLPGKHIPENGIYDQAMMGNVQRLQNSLLKHHMGAKELATQCSGSTTFAALATLLHDQGQLHFQDQQISEAWQSVMPLVRGLGTKEGGVDRINYSDEFVDNSSQQRERITAAKAVLQALGHENATLKESIKEFQRQQGLTSDGCAGANTVRKLIAQFLELKLS